MMSLRHNPKSPYTFFLFSFLILFPFASSVSDNSNTLSVDDFLKASSKRTIVSPNNVFELGFFKLASKNGDSSRWYLGIWYKEIFKREYVWIANRDKPLSNSTGTLKISETNLVLLDEFSTTVWSTNVTGKSPGSQVVAELLPNGNFILRDSNNNNNNPEKEFLWQSFDYPTDTLLPEMKLGWDKRSNLNRNLTSWKSVDDPSSGEYTYKIDTRGLPQRYIWKSKSVHHRSDSWYRVGSNGLHSSQQYKNLAFNFTTTSEEVTYSFSVTETNVYSKLRMSHSGTLERMAWPPTAHEWIRLWNAPTDICDIYATCGSNSYCDMNVPGKCLCIKGFVPRNGKAWSFQVMKHGCKRRTKLSCHGDTFFPMTKVKLPDTKAAIVDRSISLKECRFRCLQDCNCTAYANMDTQNTGFGCLIWRSDLLDMRIFTVDGQNLYVRLASSDIEDERSLISIKAIGLICAGTTVMIIVMFVIFWLWKRKQKRARAIVETMCQVRSAELGANEEFTLPQMEFQTVVMATNNFCHSNKLGEGGFGIVYKGRLPDGREIAVKRLSQMTIQGKIQFKNEVILIARIQHINLVRILGYCVHMDEHLLVFEYLENLSLDSYIFGNTQSSKLNWQIRNKIINGIARGLQYLHQDSHSRIVHRDMKASNILLDKDMIPKISDFGMARIIGREETEVNTKTLVGTFGYISPEYTTDGIFSVKSDVFSFGVLLLEIVSGKKNSRFINSNKDTSLLSCAWRNWEEGSWIELVDPSIVGEMSTSQIQEEFKRGLQIGLLCVQERAEDRPTMPSVVVMLQSHAAMPQPKPPGYCQRSLGKNTIPHWFFVY